MPGATRCYGAPGTDHRGCSRRHPRSGRCQHDRACVEGGHGVRNCLSRLLSSRICSPSSNRQARRSRAARAVSQISHVLRARQEARYLPCERALQKGLRRTPHIMMSCGKDPGASLHLRTGVGESTDTAAASHCQCVRGGPGSAEVKRNFGARIPTPNRELTNQHGCPTGLLAEDRTGHSEGGLSRSAWTFHNAIFEQVQGQ